MPTDSYGNMSWGTIASTVTSYDTDAVLLVVEKIDLNRCVSSGKCRISLN